MSDLGPGDHRFVAVETAEGIGWLTVSRQAGASATSAPSSLRRPHRGLALWILLAGFVAYFLLPRRRADERTLLYARASAGIIPDLLGVFLASAFFALPILIVTTNAPSGYVFDSGWWPIVAIMWTLALGGVVIVGVAAWYRSRRLVLLPDALRVDSIRGSRTVPHAAMTSARVESVKAPRWLRRLMLIGGMLDVRVAGQALMLESRSDPVLVITCDRAAPVRILLTGLDDPDRLLEGLRAAGVAVTDKGEGSKA